MTSLSLEDQLNSRDVELVRKLADPKFYLENFCKIKGKTPGLIPFVLNEAQKDIFNTLRKAHRVIILKARQIGFCLSPNTKVLLSNLTWVTLEDIKEGDEIISVDENTSWISPRKMRKATVEKKWDVYKEAFRIIFDDGREITATAQHKFLSKPRGGTETSWVEVQSLAPGSFIRSIVTPWEEQDYEDGWFSGMIDGEGSLAKASRTGAALTISQVDGAVWDRLISYADRKGFNYRIEVDKRKPGDAGKLGEKPVNKLVLSNLSDVMRAIGQSRPSRILSRSDWWEGKKMPGNGHSWATVVSIESIGEQRMIDLQTSTKTFVANGLVSHNSTAITGYLYHKTITTPGMNTALVGYNTEMTTELLDKVKTFIQSTPEEFRPEIHYNSKYELTFPKTNSKIMVLPSSENVGRGYTIHACVDESTIVYKRNGEQLRIIDVKPGDQVLNGNGGYSRVKEVTKKSPGARRFLQIKATQMPPLLVTEDHLILTRGDRSSGFMSAWKAAGDLKVGDYLGIPYRQIRDRVKEVQFPAPKVGYESRTLRPEPLKVSRDLGELFGWYIAEGTTANGKVVFSIHEEEVTHLLNLIQKTLEGRYTSVNVRNSVGLGAQIEVYGTALSLLIRNLLPGRSWEKTIPDIFWYWGHEFNRGLLDGIIQGDGHVGDIHGVRITTTSPSLANQIRLLLVSLRIGLATIYESQGSRYGKESRRRYDILLSGKTNWKMRHVLGLPKYVPNTIAARYRMAISDGINLAHSAFRRGRTHYWAKIRKIDEIPSPEYVYDLALEGEPHSFLTASGVVHNCLLTELAMWDKADEKLASITSAVPRDGLLVIESTPRGMGNAYHRIWMGEDNGYEKKKYGWWWIYSEEEIDQIRKEMDPLKFAQEYSLEFLSAGRSVFAPDLIKRLRTAILDIGDAYVAKDGTTHFVQKGVNDLVMYQEPRPGRTYVAGADVSEGVTGGDWSAVTIFDRETGEEVAHWHGHCAPDKFGERLNEWGRMYNNAMMAVEINNHGLTTITILKQLLYPSLYFRPSKFDTIASGWSERLGWRTTKVTRPLMIDDFNQALREGSITMHSRYLLDEMNTFVFDRGNNMIAQDGFHDDAIFASSIAFQAFKVMYSGTLDQVNYEHHLPMAGGY